MLSDDVEFNKAVLDRIRLKCQSLLQADDFLKQCIGRSYAQFLAHSSHRSKINLVLVEIVSFTSLIFFLGFQIIRRVGLKTTLQIQCSGVRLVHRSRYEVNPEIYQIPEELSEMDIVTGFYNLSYLRICDAIIVFRALRSSFSLGCLWNFQFAFKIAKDLGTLRPIFDTYDPEFILVYREYDCSLSMITNICRGQGVSVFNVMHGDKYFNTLDSFFLVDRCYCWHSYYVDLFRRQHVSCQNFRIFENAALRRKSDFEGVKLEQVGIVMPAYYTLGSSPHSDATSMSQFISCVNKLSEDYSVVLRPHPLHPDHYDPFKHHLLPSIKISAGIDEDSIDFVGSKKVVVGAYSTVLLESALMGRNTIVIDTDRLAGIKGHHFIFEYPNVAVVSMEDLEHAVRESMG